MDNEERHHSIQRCLRSLIHVCQCKDNNCRVPSCQKMKGAVSHTKLCMRKNDRCPICKPFLQLYCYHANNCKETKCLVPFCSSIKHRLKQRQIHQRLQQTQLLRTEKKMGLDAGSSILNEKQANLREMQNQKFIQSLDDASQYLVPLCSSVDNKLEQQISQTLLLGRKVDEKNLDLDAGSSSENVVQANYKEKNLSIQNCIQSLSHACLCKDINCRLPSCQKMKRVVLHRKLCKSKAYGGCRICKQVVNLCCYHAKHCQEIKCLAPFCSNVKNKLKQRHLQQQFQQTQLLKSGSTMDLDAGSLIAYAEQTNSQETNKLSIQMCIRSLEHACQCTDINCQFLYCHYMKKVVSHLKTCEKKIDGGCSICMQLFTTTSRIDTKEIGSSF